MLAPLGKTRSIWKRNSEPQPQMQSNLPINLSFILVRRSWCERIHLEAWICSLGYLVRNMLMMSRKCATSDEHIYRPCAPGSSIASKCALTTSSMCTNPILLFGYSSATACIPILISLSIHIWDLCKNNQNELNIILWLYSTCSTLKNSNASTHIFSISRMQVSCIWRLATLRRHKLFRQLKKKGIEYNDQTAWLNKKQTKTPIRSHTQAGCSTIFSWTNPKKIPMAAK